MALPHFLSALAFWRAPAADCGCAGEAGADPGFSAAVTALGAKLARADGQSEPVEFEGFIKAFPPEPRSEPHIRRLYGLAGETTLGFEAYARRLGKRYARCPELLEKVVDGLFHVAEADGAVTGDELDFLERVAQLVGLSPLSFRRLRAQHLGTPADDPYHVLGVEPDAPDEVVRAAWRRALSEHHPDRAASQGRERQAAAERRASAINAAFDAVVRERQAFAGA